VIGFDPAASGKSKHPNAGKVVEGLKRVGLNSVGIESRTLLPSPQRFQRALTIFDSRGDHKPLVPVQPARYWQENVPDFGLKFLKNPPRVG
jgi:hypothetical protein